MSKKKILVVDDEKLIVKGIRFSLEQDGMEVDCAYDGAEALEYAKNCEYDLVLLDVMLPKLDGFQVCQQIREFSDMPIVMLTAKSEDMDKILGLEYGADDYITKPFLPLEFVARVKALFRRSDPHFYDAGMNDPVTRFVCGNLVLFPVSHRVTIQEHDLNVTPTEFDFLLYMIQRADNAVSKKELAEQIWHFQGPNPEADIPEDFIKRLRKKLLSFGSTALIETVWGFGYRMSERKPEGIESI